MRRRLLQRARTPPDVTRRHADRPDDDRPDDDRRHAERPAPSPSPSAFATSAAGVPTTTTPGGTAQAPSDAYTYAEFLTPSGNIRCSIVSGPDGDGVRCDIGQRTWEPPPKAADCDFDWGSSLHLTEEQAAFGCVSDAIDPDKVLAYGQTETLGEVTCRSSKAGVRCEHRASEHGFELSRARYLLF